MQNPYTESLKPLWENKSRIYVFVDEEKIEELADNLKKEKLEVPAWSEPNVQPPMDCSLEEWINYVCWINAINFAFTNFDPPYEKFTIEYPRGEIKRGTFALGASYIRAKAEGFPFHDAKLMSTITLAEANYIFRPIDNEHKIPMLQTRWKILRGVADDLLEIYDGHWLNLFLQNGWHALGEFGGIVESLVYGFSSFYDAEVYNSHTFLFYKRAQLLAMMYQDRALNSSGRFPLLKGAGNIGPICDYEVAKALEFLGALRYSNDLKEKIKNRVILPQNSREEIEIRVVTWYVMEKLCDMLNTWMGPVDFKIWSLGRASKESHHLTPTIAY